MNCEFVKYQSLGNDFIIFDQPLELRPTDIQKLCHRHFGIGADGVITLHQQKYMRIFNADGTEAELCMNGVRCAAFFLSTTYRIPNPITLCMGNREIVCSVLQSLVHTTTRFIDGYKRHTICMHGTPYEGFAVSIGNPHFILFQTVSNEWLAQHGKFFESHSSFPHRTNVEFVTKETDRKYRVAVFERGVGCTLACGSAAAALAGLLFEIKEIQEGEPISITMLGGSLIACVEHKEILIQASASYVFSGKVQIC